MKIDLKCLRETCGFEWKTNDDELEFRIRPCRKCGNAMIATAQMPEFARFTTLYGTALVWFSQESGTLVMFQKGKVYVNGKEITENQDPETEESRPVSEAEAEVQADADCPM